MKLKKRRTTKFSGFILKSLVVFGFLQIPLNWIGAFIFLCSSPPCESTHKIVLAWIMLPVVVPILMELPQIFFIDTDGYIDPLYCLRFQTKVTTFEELNKKALESVVPKGYSLKKRTKHAGFTSYFFAPQYVFFEGKKRFGSLLLVDCTEIDENQIGEELTKATLKVFERFIDNHYEMAFGDLRMTRTYIDITVILCFNSLSSRVKGKIHGGWQWLNAQASNVVVVLDEQSVYLPISKRAGTSKKYGKVVNRFIEDYSPLLSFGYEPDFIKLTGVLDHEIEENERRGK